MKRNNSKQELSEILWIKTCFCADLKQLHSADNHNPVIKQT